MCIRALLVCLFCVTGSILAADRVGVAETCDTTAGWKPNSAPPRGEVSIRVPARVQEREWPPGHPDASCQNSQQVHHTVAKRQSA